MPVGRERPRLLDERGASAGAELLFTVRMRRGREVYIRSHDEKFFLVHGAQPSHFNRAKFNQT